MYVAESEANLNKSAYDSYVKAFRWASDRIDSRHGGIIGFVTNGAWLDANGLDGMRKCFEKEFSSIYVFNLRACLNFKVYIERVFLLSSEMIIFKFPHLK